MRENGVQKIWAEGGHVVNGWLGIPSAFSAEVMAHQPFDSITVDMQHGIVDYQAAVGMLQAISTRGATPLARVPWNDPAAIMKILDAGAYGVVCPMINNAEECERFVGACRYVPDGYRSYGPIRAAMYGGSDYAAAANGTILTFAMIETAEAMDNLDAIMSVPGLDAIYVGPNDLSLSLGFAPSPDPKEPKVVEAMAAILAAAQRNDVRAGIHTTGGEMTRRMFAQGFQFCTLANDVRMLVAGANAEIKAARGD